MTRILLALIVLCTSVAAQAQDLVVRGDRLFLAIEVEGTDTVALLDSGAELTVINRTLADDLGLGGGEEVTARGTGAATTTARLVEGVRLGALGRRIDPPVVAVMDLSDIERRLVGSAVPVILGREFFDQGPLSIDIEGGTIEWLAAEGARAVEALQLESAHGIETIPVTFGESTVVRADFDLGNGTGLLVSAALARELGLEPVGVEPGGGIGGEVGRLVVRVPELTIAGVTFHNVKAHVSENLQVAANVGVGLLRNFLIVTDFPNRKVWLDQRDKAEGHPVEIMVVATMHGGHVDNPRYSYEDLYSIVADFDPDLVGTEIRQEDLARGDDYLARNYPLEMRELALRYRDRIVGIDWLGADLEGRPVPVNYWGEQSEIIRLQRLLEKDDALRSPEVDEAQERQRRILESATAASLNDGRYDLATSAYYRALAELLEATQYARLTDFYAERDRRIAENAIAAVSFLQRARPDVGGRILFAVGADHRGPLVEALRRRFGDDVRLVPVP